MDDKDFVQLLFILAKNEDWDALLSRILQVENPEILSNLTTCVSYPFSSETLMDDEGTLLHIVTSSCAVRNIAVIKAILDKGGPELAAVPDAFGMTALHASIRSGAPTEVVQLLVTTNPNAVRMKDHFCLTPLGHVCQRLIMREERHRYTKDDDEAVDYHLWECARLMLCAMSTSNSARNMSFDQLIMHACIRADECPFALQQRVMKRFAHQLETPDMDGNLPLHIAASLPIYSDEQDLYKIQQVLTACPTAIEAVNQRQQLPLDVAIRAGRTWSTGARILFEAFPEALFRQDIPVAHYPMILAELGTKASIESAYRIIKATPDLFHRTS